MAKKNKNKSSEKYYSDYPIKSLFQVSMLAACISFILFYLKSSGGVIDSLFKSFLVFLSFSVAGGAIIVVVFSILGNIKQREYDEMIAQQNEAKAEMEAIAAAQKLATETQHHTKAEIQTDESKQEKNNTKLHS
jgi:basic membrane lipoprotein Med (substrate-binding protein (PBP1-ABC) superfamily)